VSCFVHVSSEQRKKTSKQREEKTVMPLMPRNGIPSNATHSTNLPQERGRTSDRNQKAGQIRGACCFEGVEEDRESKKKRKDSRQGKALRPLDVRRLGKSHLGEEEP